MSIETAFNSPERDEIASRTDYLTITSRRPAAGVSVVTVAGEIDAANADEFIAAVSRQLEPAGQLVVDMTDVNFFGTAAFSALHRIGMQCALLDEARWAIVPGARVLRVLRICDPDGELPTVGSLDSALNGADSTPQPLLQLVAQPR